jgi:N6-L-threonylcarbamoyladenine synthase
MLTLGIETSCDETACAVLENSSNIRSNVISSSLAQHRQFGGVVPEIASRHSLEAIDLVYLKALRDAKLAAKDLDLIAVTKGPGLIGSIFVGVSFAKALSFALDLPIVGVNHIEAHLEANFIGKRKPKCFVGLVVSGGHTSLIRCEEDRYDLLGETVDDAIGEAYDKVAKLLGLGYPGGPEVDRLAREGDPGEFLFTKPKQKGKFDFSFSGVKTAALHQIQASPKKFKSQKVLKSFCASFQEAVMSWVTQKTILACVDSGIKAVAVGGGVSANSRLRKMLTEACRKNGVQLYLPEFKFTTDNAAMIARMGYTLYKRGVRSKLNFEANPSLKMGDRTNNYNKIRDGQ